jgi:uncharacterized protein (UPF0332 family)
LLLRCFRLAALGGLFLRKTQRLRALFDQHWVKKGRVSVKLGRVYRTLFVNRQKADYADFVEYGIDEVERWLAEAERFVQTIGQLVEAELNEIPS